MKNINIYTEKESDIVKAILEYLAIIKIMAWRNNSGFILARDKNGKNYGHQMGPSGSPDIIGVMPDGKFLGIEVKTKIGVVTDNQKDFLKRLNDNNGFAFVARSIDDVQNEMKRYFEICG